MYISLFAGVSVIIVVSIRLLLSAEKSLHSCIRARDTIAKRLFGYIGSKDTLFWGRYSLMVEYG